MNLLREYEVDPVRGFLPPTDPLEALPAGFDVWEGVSETPVRLAGGSAAQSSLVMEHHEAKGTGGTDLKMFLMKTREETQDKLLAKD